jgi:NTP pyrophosphatase (non-canonical NTP hydrolase)
MELKKLCKQAHKIAKEKGFWLEKPNGGLAKRNLSELLMLCVSELGEACEALRKNFRQSKYKEWRKDSFEDEIADTFIRLADLCEAEGIDIEWQIKQKMEYNKGRPQKHGKSF